MPLSTKQSTEAGDSFGALLEPLSDENVVRQVQAGDVASFELIMRRYNQRLFRVARSIIGENAEAEDIVQEAYIRAYKNLGQFEGRSLFSTWLTKIAVYEAAARRRKRRRLRLVAPVESETDVMAFTSRNPDASEEAGQKELGRVLTCAVDALPSDLRVVFTLRIVEQLSTSQTAECLELTPANVKIRLHRARLRLQAWIDRQIGEESRQLYIFDGQRCDRIVKNVMSRIADVS
jgi:RNA polymerase sigma-70 factor, ECF subfamily